jgi:hypothetical protein
MSIASRATRAVQRSATFPTLPSNKLSYGSSKDLFWRRRQFSGRARASPLQIAPDRRPDSLELRPTSRWSAAFAAESRVEVRRPDTQGVAQIVHRGRSEVLAPKQQYGDLERRVTRLGRARSDPEHAFNGSSLSKP